MSLKNLIITGSINTYPTLSYDQKTYISSNELESFPLEEITGSNAGVWPNISQSWSSSNITPFGEIGYIHNTEEEWFNGEFSGSSIIASTQSLNNVLEINNTLVNYRLYWYNNLVTSPSDFINTNTSPNQGEIYLYNYSFWGVSAEIAIKINRIDEQGNDNTLSLQELTNIRIKTSDLGIINFNIQTITENPTYYFYRVAQILPGNVTASNDANILDYTFNATSVFLNIPAGVLANATASNYIAVTDPSSSFDATSGLYIAKNTSNINLQYTASFIIDTIGAQQFAVILGNPDNINDNITSSISFTTSGIPTSFIISGSFTTLENSKYCLKFINYSATDPFTVSLINWVFTQSIQPQTYSNLIILEPYLTSTFNYSDNDVLMNNAFNLETDPNFFRVNYENGILNPSNQTQIISRSAEYADVKPYNYSSLAQTLPRYKGVKNTTEYINKWTSSSLNEGNYGKLPSIDSLDNIIYEFEWGGGTTPEILGWGSVRMGTLYNTLTTSSVIPILPGHNLTTQLQKRNNVPNLTLVSHIWDYNNYMTSYKSQSVDDYYYILNGNNPTNTEVSFFSYAPQTNDKIPIKAKILTTEFGVPDVSNFILTSSRSYRYGYITNGSSILTLIDSGSVNRVNKTNQNYSPGALFEINNLYSSPSESIYDSLINGDRWFITLFNNLDYNTNNEIDNNYLTPYNYGFTSIINNNYVSPLAFKGVFEILWLDVLIGSPNLYYFYLDKEFTQNRDIGNYDLGALIWKADTTSHNVIFQNPLHISKGAFINKYPTKIIKNNFNYITKTYGGNKPL